MNSRQYLPPAILLMGPTASGKTHCAIEIAKTFPCEIISVDSALVYRHMDIGTAKPSTEIRCIYPHHLIDIIDPTQSYSAAEFRSDALKLMWDITGRKKIPLLVGGTMLYFKALREGLSELPRANTEIRAQIDKMAKEMGWPKLHEQLKELDPETAERLKPGDAQRIQRALEIYYLSGKPMSELLKNKANNTLPYRIIQIALVPSNRSVLHQRIALRFTEMLDQGLIDEVQNLRNRFKLSESMPSMRCVGYRQVWRYLDGLLDHTQLIEKGVVATRQLAKRQLTWLRAMSGITEFDCLENQLHEKLTDYLHSVL